MIIIITIISLYGHTNHTHTDDFHFTGTRLVRIIIIVVC